MRNWYETVDSNNPLIVSSRIRLARNIKGIPFPKRMMFAATFINEPMSKTAMLYP